MKTLSTLKAHYTSGSLSTADFWLVTLRDGTQLGFTDHPEAVEIDGVVYEGYSGFDRTATEVGSGLAADNSDLFGILDSTRITAEDVQGRKFEGATVHHFSVDYNNATGAKDKHNYGFLGAIRLEGTTWKAEYHTQTSLLERELCEVRTPYCRVALGSPRCGVTLSTGNGYIKAFEVVSVLVARNTFIASVTGGMASSWYAHGVCTFSAGANVGLEMDIKRNTAAGTVEVLFGFPFTIAVGDTGSLTVGCNHKLKNAGDVPPAPYTGDCRAKFSNAANFQGDCEIPGIDRIIAADRT